MTKFQIKFTSQIWQEGDQFVAYSPELDVSSCAKTKDKATKNLLEAVELFLGEAEKMGTLKSILEEAGFIKQRVKKENIWQAPELLSLEKLSLAL